MRGNACDVRREVSARKMCMTHPRDDEREKAKKKKKKEKNGNTDDLRKGV
jgi:hypothetical protein